MPKSSTFNSEVIAHRLSIGRMASYLDDCDNNLERALDLYAWNAQIAAAFLEDLGRLEVVLRNRFDEALTALVSSAVHASHWFDHRELFLGRGGKHTLKAIAKAKRRAAKGGKRPISQSKVIVELGFGFWRFLCSSHYHTSMWVPALAAQFPDHPAQGNVVQVRADVESRMDRLLFLRNRVAHHEPLHRRPLADDAAMIMELAQWMCFDTHAWMTGLSRVPAVLASRPA